MEEEKLYSVNQVAVVLKVHPLTIRRYIKEGKLKAKKLAGNIRISQSSIDNFVQDIFPTSYGVKTEKKEGKEEKGLEFTTYDPFLRLKGRGMSLKSINLNQ